MTPYVDIHTHLPGQLKNVTAVYNLLLDEPFSDPSSPFSAGLHPWYADQLSMDQLSGLLDHCALSENFMAFGETGLDKICGIPMKMQQQVFELHLKKAVQYRKPIILHCVKAWEEIVDMTAAYPVIKIIHAYNGSEELTKQLINKGFRFSVGKAILHPDSNIHTSINLIDLSILFCETDTSGIPIQDIYKEVSAALRLEEEVLKHAVFANYCQLKNA